jgi:hypothetical protein
VSSNIFDVNALIDKYPDIVAPRPPDPADDPTVNATIAAEKLESRAFPRGNEYNQWLFDPNRSPEMHEIATKAHRRLRELMARDEVEPNDSRMLVHFVGSDDVHAVYPGWTANRFAEDLRKHNATQPYCDVYACNIGISDNCGRSSTVLMPLLFGDVLLIFECCGVCYSEACPMAGDGRTLSEINARSALPPGAYIDPGSPVPPTA